MTGPAQRLVKHALIVVIGSGLLVVSAIILTPMLGRVTGYANTQPPLSIIRLPNQVPDYEADRVLRLMRSLLAQRPDIENNYWPIPKLIEEKKDCWLVTFTTKTPVYTFLGFEHTVEPSNPHMYVTVNKADYTVNFGKWCK
jgi:hypothetical protein